MKNLFNDKEYKKKEIKREKVDLTWGNDKVIKLEDLEKDGKNGLKKNIGYIDVTYYPCGVFY